MRNGTSLTAGSQPAHKQVTVLSPLRVLAIDEEVPFPPNTGKRIRTWNLLRRLAQKHSITLLCYGRESNREFEPVRKSGIRLQLVDPLPELNGVSLYARLLGNVLSPYPYSVDKHYTHRFQNAVNDLLATGDFDLLHCEWTPYARYQTERNGLASVLATHNVESQIWERRAQHSKTLPARVFFSMQARKMASFERNNLPRMSVVTAVSPDDLRQTSAWTKQECFLVENGVDLEQFRPLGAGEGSELLFLGSLDWFPNRDAVEYMVNEILPLLRASDPQIRLRVVGRRPPADFIRNLAEREGVEVLGEVDDVRPYLEHAGIVVVPLRIGGGSRIKILEALAAGKAVISTRIGAEGLAVEDNRNISLADTPEGFVKRVRLLNSEAERLRLGSNGRTLVEQRYSWDNSALALESAWVRAVNLHRAGEIRA